MELTETRITNMGFPAGGLKTSDSVCFTAALEWLNENTDFELDTEDPEESVRALPASAKVFITKYIGMLQSGGLSGSTVTSETIGGMSRSYGSAAESGKALWLLAKELLGRHLIRGIVSLTGDYSKWA